jgi:hypothetical protein
LERAVSSWPLLRNPANLLTKLTDEKLAEIDAWLDELESEIPSEKGALSAGTYAPAWR